MLKPASDCDDGPDLPALTAAGETALAEARLIGQVVLRQRTAFDALYRCYHPRLLRFLDRMMRRPDLADEVLNDTMFVVWNRAGTYNGRCKVSTWIFAIAHNKALKALQRMDEPVADDDADNRPSPAPNPEQQLDQRQLLTRLRRAIDGLSFDHRAVVELTYFHGADCREIAQIVDCPVATVKTRMFHARRHLKASLCGRLEDFL